MSKTRISLLIELLKSFSEKELEAFSKFVESEYFNEDKKLIDLLKKLKRYALKTEKFTEELQFKVYEDTFCDKPLKQKELTKKQYVFLNNKQHKLLRLAEQFLMNENLNANETVQMELLYQPLIDRNQTNLYQRHLKSDTKKLRIENKHGLDYYVKQYKLQEATLNFLFKYGQIRKEDNYDELHYYLDINYILEKLAYHLAQISLKGVYQNKSYSYSSLDEISSLLAKSEYTENPLVQIYLSNINLVENKSDKSYRNLVSTLSSNHNILPTLFLRIFYDNLTNYCSNQIRKGNIRYYKKLFEIYQIMHSNNLLVIDNLIDESLIKNIITVSCSIEAFDWARQILNQYKKFINIKIRDSVYFYNNGVIEFNQKNFSLAQEWFLKVEKINDRYEIELRIFILQCIFELEQDYSYATKQSFESAKQFFKRNTRLSKVIIKSYLNFISIFTDLYKYKHKATKLKLSKIEEKMQKLEVIRKKKWLSDKILELG